MSSVVENRRYVRLPKAYSVEIKKLRFPIAQEVDLESNSADISEGGICIESHMPFEIGGKMQVRVNIPLLNRFAPGFLKIYENDAEQYFMAIAEVVWCRMVDERYMIGMQFINVDESQLRALSALIADAMSNSLHQV